MEILKEKIAGKKLNMAVIGLGYVGLPLAAAFAEKGFSVTGIDLDEEKVDILNSGRSYITDISDDKVASLVESGRFRAVSDYGVLGEMDAVSICVPTPLAKTKDPDVSYILAVTEELKKHMHPHFLVVLESTTYPGTTRELVLPPLQSTGLKVGEDFFLAFSPERIDPGNREYGIENTPKVIGGTTYNCLEIARYLYSRVINEIVPVSSTDSAEMVKLLENTFRSVNIGLVNEVAIMCRVLGLDPWEVIRAAGTKPFGFMPFYPGPGLGGHCIPIDPQYLSWKLKTMDYNARFIELAGEINNGMPKWVVHRIADLLNDREKSVRGSSILLLGMAYKRDVGDLRESPALEIAEILLRKGARLSYHDPHVGSLYVGGEKFSSVPLDEDVLSSADMVVVTTDHGGIDYALVAKRARCVFDTRNVMRRFSPRDNIYFL